MRIRSPISRTSFSLRLTLFDVLWAAAAPWLALWARGATPMVQFDAATVVPYCMVATLASLVAFLIFRIRDGMTHLFSVHDAIEVAKAVLMTECLTLLVLFSATRLDGIPRSTAIIHALVLSAGLLTARAFVRLYLREARDDRPAESRTSVEHVIVVGSNRLSALCMELMNVYTPGRFQFMAVVDDNPAMTGRSVGGLKVIGSCALLPSIIEEFQEHGLTADRILIGGDADSLSAESLKTIESLSLERGIPYDFIPHLLQLDGMKGAPSPVTDAPAPRPAAAPRLYTAKRYLDFAAALVLLIALLPVILTVSFLVLLDVGYPIFYWQRRVGLNGRIFQLHKFRTLKSSFDSTGNRISNSERMSVVGQAIRQCRLDEIPQLLNVLVGDMSLIGPRPLLPEDQPTDPRIRLSVRPGLTGWAQVNGGRTLTPQDKAALDEWYVRNATFWLDFKILFLTLGFLVHGERRYTQGSAHPAQPPSPPSPPAVEDSLPPVVRSNSRTVSL